MTRSRSRVRVPSRPASGGCNYTSALFRRLPSQGIGRGFESLVPPSLVADARASQSGIEGELYEEHSRLSAAGLSSFSLDNSMRLVGMNYTAKKLVYDTLQEMIQGLQHLIETVSAPPRVGEVAGTSDGVLIPALHSNTPMVGVPPSPASSCPRRPSGNC